jgi:Cu/Zn superoxide dismutase
MTHRKDYGIASLMVIALALGGCGDDDGGGQDAGSEAGSGAGDGGSGGSGGAGAGGSGGGGNGGSSAGSGGTGGTGGGGSGGSDAGGPADAGELDGSVDDAGIAEDSGIVDSGTALPTAVAQFTATGVDDSGIQGTATFTQEGSNVTLVIALTNCPAGAHEVHIHQGTSCAAQGNAAGNHWGPTRGEGIPDVVCAGGTGSVTYTRTAENASLAWSIGGTPMTNIVGHAMIVHATGSTARIACGVIEASQ